MAKTVAVVKKNMITVIGLGREKGDITKSAIKAVKNADVVFVRTLLSDAGKQVKKFGAISMDDLYETCQDFDELNAKICQRIMSCDSSQNVVYCVDGNGTCDSSVEHLYALKPQIGFVAGVSEQTNIMPTSSSQSYMAHDVLNFEVIPDTSVAVLVGGICDKFIAGDIKLWLLRFYDGDEKIYFTSGKNTIEIALEDLDRQKKYRYNTSIFISAKNDFNKKKYGYSDLLRIMQVLTSEDGCEWDKVQTHQTIATNAIEEAYELVDAIENDDIDNMLEECGDVILQGILHSDIARRYGEFTADDCIDALCKKLVTRHTHIFGDDKATNATDAINFWEKAKEKEKSTTTIADKLDKVPSSFPSILKIEKIIKKIKKEGIVLDEQNLIEMIKTAVDKNDYASVVCGAVGLFVLKGEQAEIVLLDKANQMISSAKNAQNLNKMDLTQLIKNDDEQ